MSAPLSNFLTVLAAEVVSEVASFKRSSAAAHRAYLSAGAKLVDARANARRGQWAPFLAACGVSERVARNMMRLARAGLTADEVTERGGVQASLESLREAEKAELNSGNGIPAGAPLAGESPSESLAEPAETPSLAHETEAAAGEPPAVRESGPRRPASAIPPTRDESPRPWAANALALAMGEDAALSPAARRRADKLARFLRAPEVFSSNSFTQPASWRRTRWMARSWSAVDTRAQGTRFATSCSGTTLACRAPTKSAAPSPSPSPSGCHATIPPAPKAHTNLAVSFKPARSLLKTTSSPSC